MNRPPSSRLFIGIPLFVATAVLLISLAGCIAPLILPTEEDAARANLKWQGSSLSALHRGHELYIVKCSSCHYLYRPHQFTAEKWNEEIDEMATRSKLTEDEKENILRYLLTMCEAPVQAER